MADVTENILAESAETATLRAEFQSQGVTFYELSMVVSERLETMFLRKPTYDTKKAAFKLLLADATDAVGAGELILAGGYLAGYNFYTNEDTRLEAAYKAAHLVDFNQTATLKKN